MTDREDHIKGRVIFAFVVMVALFVGIVGSNIFYFSHVEEHLKRVVGTHNVQMAIMNDVLDLARQRSITLQHMLLIQEPFTLDEQLIKMGEIANSYNILRDKLLKLPTTDAEKKLLDTQHKQTSQTGILQAKVIRLITEDKYEDAKALFYREAMPSQIIAMNLMHQFVTMQNGHNHQELQLTTGEIRSERNKTLFFLLVGAMVSVVVAVWVTRKLKLEIKRRNQIENDLERRVEQRTQELQRIAFLDTLTSLPNRAVFAVELENAFSRSRRSGSKVALFFLDLDGFKAINDKFSHAIGDKVLLDTAHRLQQSVRGDDVLARIGGDEFTLILNEIDERENVTLIAEKIIHNINQPLIVDGQTCRVGVSIGVAYYPDDADNPDDLMTRADDAMYVAKRSGKNRLSGV